MDKVLILLDDDSTMNLVNEKMLSKRYSSHAVEVFDDPINALEYFSSQDDKRLNSSQFVIYLDLNMPNLSGFEFLEELESMMDELNFTFDLKVTLLTANDGVFAQEKIKVFPMIENFILKPLTPNDIPLVA